ncbi:tetratricopeptide repeat protein [Rhodoplanes sp. TEM]|uniref:Tetratricopeptide repeat protein n=1 Tax=Rhodoplanes tepidamans TaxID=200616 RepID=A0ABT5J829_RHOTP|nr:MULTISPECIES: tetratricopeptide repeat protein [Rhodoplanes]MDC7785805.1 tetratricopeptide repeat protein [Rhodoplanes tepidamans]MDC7984072.1 tetratricopeptide repeat protein [Rhodoplanes sp. TEM]MDQ0354632.1 Tfp pilus assembly protein PilF [Rhodoplanes tepidamans]
MRAEFQRFAFVTVVGLLWLTGCETTSVKLPELPSFGQTDVTGTVPVAIADGDITGSTGGTSPKLVQDNMTPSAPSDDLSVGREQFRQGNYGMAEKHCRRAVEQSPKSADAWLCLAAAYDRLKRFDLADRAYLQLIRLTGRTAAVLNNMGYSYMLRGDYRRARATLNEAAGKDPANPFVQNNLALLAEATATKEGIR